MSSPNLLSAVLPLIGIAVGALLQFLLSKRIEAKKHLTLQKSDAYASYVKAFSAVAQKGRDADALFAVLESKARICVYGSERVVKGMADFERMGAATVTPEQMQAMVEIISAMRQDLVGSDRHVAAIDTREILFSN